MNLNSGETILLSDIEADMPSNRFNDGKCDPSGRLWVGSMGWDMNQYDANLYMIDEDGGANVYLVNRYGFPGRDVTAHPDL